MHYKSFTIRNYRAIVGPLEIDAEGSPLTPIIGVNESGKTTILQALFAFDYYNDDLNDNGRHLKDTVNLYGTSSPDATVSAKIGISKSELKTAFLNVAHDAGVTGVSKSEAQEFARKRSLPEVVIITRNIPKDKYNIGPGYFGSDKLQQALAEDLISNLPYILYFDDFRDKVQERIEIPTSSDDKSSGWLAILEQLFKQTDKTFSVYKLAKMDERQRKTVLAQVRKKLNETLTRQWHEFKLDESEALTISIDFRSEAVQGLSQVQANAPEPAATPAQAAATTAPTIKNFITLDVVETLSGNDKYFHISDRSKGFYWFFNFVMKLEFNAKLVEGHDHAIYLLDEPGSYLHAFAQRKLCQKLRRLSEKNWVAYCTHSHYLLDPEVISVNSVKVAEKDSNGHIGLIRLGEYRSPVSQKRSALQPLLDALQIRPFALDLDGQQTTVITEGIYDYFALEIFKADRRISILPSVGADSIKYFISLMIAWHIEFRALWDNDQEGREHYTKAVKHFGDEVAKKYLRLLPCRDSTSKRILQDLFNGGDLTKIRTDLGLPSNCSFEHTINALFYSSKRRDLVSSLSQLTKQNFDELFGFLSLG